MPGVIQSSQNYMSSQEAGVVESVFELGPSEITGALKMKWRGHLVTSLMRSLTFRVTLRKYNIDLTFSRCIKNISPLLDESSRAVSSK